MNNPFLWEAVCLVILIVTFYTDKELGISGTHITLEPNDFLVPTHSHIFLQNSRLQFLVSSIYLYELSPCCRLLVFKNILQNFGTYLFIARTESTPQSEIEERT